MKKVLFIAFQFPPLLMGGVKRPFAFARNLQANGIQMHVLTLSPKSFQQVYPSVSQSNEYSKNKLEFKVDYIESQNNAENDNKIKKFLKIFFNLYRGSEYKLWQQNLYSKVEDILQKENYDYLMVTAPPFGMLKLAKRISKKFDIPMITDMRDAWLLWNNQPYGSVLHYLYTKYLERKYFTHSKIILSTSLQTIEDWRVTHPTVDEIKYRYLPNGFDEDFKNDIKDQIHIDVKDKLDITYVGSFYFDEEARSEMLTPWWKRKYHRKLQYWPRKQDWLYRSPYFIFKSFGQLLVDHPEFRQKIRLNFVGKKQDWFDNMINKFDLADIVFHHGVKSWTDTLEIQKKSDFLLLTSAKVYDGRDCFIAGKTFEYFHICKPILSFTCDGAQKDILTASGMSIDFNPENAIDNSRKLKEIFSNQFTLNLNKKFILSHVRSSQMKEFASVIQKLS